MRRLLLLGWLAAAPAAWGEDADPFGPPPPPRPGAASSPAAPPAEEPPPPAAFAAWLARDDWLCRALAAQELRLRSDDGVVEVLAAALAREPDPRVLGALLRALAHRGRDDLLAEGGSALAERLVALAAHAHGGVAERARAALEPLAGGSLPADPSRLRGWLDKARPLFEEDAARARARRAATGAAVAPPPADRTGTFARAPARAYADLDRIHREGLEVVVCLDQTGSMEPVLAQARAGILALLRRLKALAPRLRTGLVTYDDEAHLRAALTPDETVVERAMRRVVAVGGGDEEEGVDKAVLLALDARRVGWSRKAQRVVLVVGDAPPHEDDLPGLLRRLAAARDDLLFEAPVRVDTLSAIDGGAADDRVPRFAEIAKAGGGQALRVEAGAGLADALLVAPFGPTWREPVRELLADLRALDAARGAEAGRR